jgi:hypothetical protein
MHRVFILLAVLPGILLVACIYGTNQASRVSVLSDKTVSESLTLVRGGVLHLMCHRLGAIPTGEALSIAINILSICYEEKDC